MDNGWCASLSSHSHFRCVQRCGVTRFWLLLRSREHSLIALAASLRQNAYGVQFSQPDQLLLIDGVRRCAWYCIVRKRRYMFELENKSIWMKSRFLFRKKWSQFGNEGKFSDYNFRAEREREKSLANDRENVWAGKTYNSPLRTFLIYNRCAFPYFTAIILPLRVCGE